MDHIDQGNYNILSYVLKAEKRLVREVPSYPRRALLGAHA